MIALFDMPAVQLFSRHAILYQNRKLPKIRSLFSYLSFYCFCHYSIKCNCKKNGVATLMHLPKGRAWESEPLSTCKNAPRHRRVHSCVVDREPHFGLPLALKSNLFQIRFSSYFGKCEIKANAFVTQDFSLSRDKDKHKKWNNKEFKEKKIKRTDSWFLIPLTC